MIVVILQTVCWSDLGSIVVLVEGGEACGHRFTLIILVEVFCWSFRKRDGHSPVQAEVGPLSNVGRLALAVTMWVEDVECRSGLERVRRICHAANGGHAGRR